ncbi:MAG TPA: rod shape-determining protein [Chloroflexota bacterium]|nr:rod shape-determining protein [Chloroflexota bacterium]
MFSRQIGIDLGTANLLIYVKGRGIVLNEPAVVAVTEDNRIVAAGDEARQMIGRTPQSVTVVRPMRDGVIADYVRTEGMLRYFLRKVIGSVSMFRPEVMISIPAGITSVEKRAVHDAVVQAGAKRAFLIEEPIAAAIGANVPIASPQGNLIVDIGGGTTEVAVISLNDIVLHKTVRMGGMYIDDVIASHIRKKHGLMIGDSTAEQVKCQIGSALPLDEELVMEVRGRDQLTGLPKSIPIRTNEIVEAIADPLATVVDTVRTVLEDTPPELASDIMDRGMVMTGGGSLLRNIDQLLTKVTDVPCHLAEFPLYCVAVGTGKALENYDSFKSHLA